MPQASADAPARTAAPNRADRDAKGRWSPGNTAAVLHALDSPRDLAELDAEVSAFVAGAVADDGGKDEVPVRRQSLLDYRARLHRRIVQLDGALEVRGLVDRRNKLRVAWLQMLATLIASARSIDSLLGLERRQRQGLTLAEILAERHEADQHDKHDTTSATFRGAEGDDTP